MDSEIPFKILQLMLADAMDDNGQAKDTDFGYFHTIITQCDYL